MQRSPAVAHQFYPGDRGTLISALQKLIPEVPATSKSKAIALISPHAGYIYSGPCAGETFAGVDIPPDVVLMGPNHHGQGAMVALMNRGDWLMPQGPVQINEQLADLVLAGQEVIEVDELAHRHEHSLEVQVPFLQYLQPDLRLVPLCISHIPYPICVAVGEQLAAAIKSYGKPVLIVASSDMTHYESRQAASRKDRLAIDQVEALDPQGLYNTVVGQGITMCGIMPATIALVAALKLGASKAKLVRYTDSGEASGDTNQVVGYAGLTIA